MSTEAAHRFEEEFAPRIAAALASQFGPTAHVEVVPRAGHGHPTRVHIVGHASEYRHPYGFPLNVSLTWDVDEIASLFEPGGEKRFEHYLDALPRKLASWETARPVDFASRTQGEPEVLLGGLDFEG